MWRSCGVGLTRRRSPVEIKISLLYAIQEEAKPTRIMLLTNLSWGRLIFYLQELNDEHLISREKVNGKRRIYLTEDGKKILETFKPFCTFDRFGTIAKLNLSQSHIKSSRKVDRG